MQAENSQEQLLQLHTGSEKQSTNNQNSTEIVQKQHIEGTGFDIVGNKEHGYFVAIGKYRITENKPIEDELYSAIGELSNTGWEIIAGMIGAVTEAVKEMEEAQKIHNNEEKEK